MKNLKGKIILITGASSGIGKATAYACAQHGANLILTARRINRLKRIANAIIKEFKVKVLPVQLDVRNYTEVKKFIKSLKAEWKKVDVLINNAGLAKGLDKIYEGKIENWEEMIDTNVKGLLYVSREVLPIMAKRKEGHIINIGSTAGHEVYPNGNVYCSTKFAVKAITRGMRIDLLDKNIKVSSVDPGMVNTEFSTVRFDGDKERAEIVYKGLKPLNAEDVADSVLFCLTRPPHVNISEIILTPSAQATSTILKRK